MYETNKGDDDVESSQLTGKEFYLLKNDYKKQLDYVENL